MIISDCFPQITQIGADFQLIRYSTFSYYRSFRRLRRLTQMISCSLAFTSYLLPLFIGRCPMLSATRPLALNFSLSPLYFFILSSFSLSPFSFHLFSFHPFTLSPFYLFPHSLYRMPTMNDCPCHSCRSMTPPRYRSESTEAVCAPGWM